MSLLLSMAIFSLSMSISPGPVNVVALTSGVNYGFTRSLNFVTGATLGFIALLSLVGLGLGEMSEQFPLFISALKVAGCLYILYIGIQIFKDKSAIALLSNTTLESQLNSSSHSSNRHSPRFTQGWLMQWLNPKAWIACIAGCSAFNVYHSNERLLMFSLIYLVFCFLGIAAWALLGKKIKHWLTKDCHVIRYNQIMGSTLCLLAIALVLE